MIFLCQKSYQTKLAGFFISGQNCVVLWFDCVTWNSSPKWTLIQGHAVSSSAVSVPLYTSETSQPEVRKITGVFAIICYCFGSAASSVLGKKCPIHSL